MNRYDLATHTRILAERDKRSQRIEALQREHNRCAWCGEAPVDPGQPFCLTHEAAGNQALALMEAVR